MKPNIEFSCRPESDRYAPVRRTTFSSARRTQADNCNDLLHLQPTMAGPYHAAQSPEPFPIPRPDRHSWAYLSALSVTASRLSDSGLHTFSPAKARGPYRLHPRHQNRRPCRLLFRSPSHDTSHPRERSPIRGGPPRAAFISDPGEDLYLHEIPIRTETGSLQAALVLSALHPLFQTALTNGRSPPRKSVRKPSRHLFLCESA